MLILGMAAASVTSCGTPEPELFNQALIKASSQPNGEGLVWMFPGLVGLPWELGSAYRALLDAGLQKEVRFFQWPQAEGDLLTHLTGYHDNVAQAAAVAQDILQYHQEHPDRPIDLIGYSAGAFIALKVVEALPKNLHVHNVVLVQPGVSPTYDLTEALRRIDGKLVVFYSPRDWLLCGLFTRLLGTLDRRFEFAAGKEGFNLQAAVPDASLWTRVEQLAWTPEWAQFGHTGRHMAILTYEWNKHFVAPYVIGPDDANSPRADSEGWHAEPQRR